MRVTLRSDGIPDLSIDDLMQVYGICPICKSDDAFVAFTNAEYWEHAESEHPEDVTTRTTRDY